MKTDIYLIIGLTKESRHWSPAFIDSLKSEFEPHSIQMVDLSGSGKVRHLKSPILMKKIAAAARSQVVFHEGHRRILISISLGGMSAWSWVDQFPNDFTHLVMINSSLAGLSPLWKRVQPVGMWNFIKVALASRGKKKEKLILDLCSNNRQHADEIYPAWVKIGEEANMSLANTIRQVIAGGTFSAKSTPKIPLLVMAAKHDRLAHYSCSEDIVKHASTTAPVKFVLTEDPLIGHAFHVDAPQVLAEEIRSWVGSDIQSPAPFYFFR